MPFGWSICIPWDIGRSRRSGGRWMGSASGSVGWSSADRRSQKSEAEFGKHDGVTLKGWKQNTRTDSMRREIQTLIPVPTASCSQEVGVGQTMIFKLVVLKSSEPPP